LPRTYREVETIACLVVATDGTKYRLWLKSAISDQDCTRGVKIASALVHFGGGIEISIFDVKFMI
jgi:hypothetical protein